MLDLINAGFELLAGVMLLGHCQRLRRDRVVAGVSVLSVAFFNVWGFWNLFYYPALDQVLSFVGGLGVVAANTYWLFLNRPGFRGGHLV